MSEKSIGVSRRNVLKAAGTGAVASSVIVGSASAEEFSAINEIRFCGCSSVCVDSSVPKDIYIAWDETGEWTAETVQCTRPHSDKDLGLGSTFCFELTEETLSELGIPEDAEAKIVAIEDRTFKFCNPNNCAQKAQAALEAQTDGTACAQGEFTCSDPDEFGIVVETSKCRDKDFSE